MQYFIFVTSIYVYFSIFQWTLLLEIVSAVKKECVQSLKIANFFQWSLSPGFYDKSTCMYSNSALKMDGPPEVYFCGWSLASLCVSLFVHQRYAVCALCRVQGRLSDTSSLDISSFHFHPLAFSSTDFRLGFIYPRGWNVKSYWTSRVESSGRPIEILRDIL